LTSSCTSSSISCSTVAAGLPRSRRLRRDARHLLVEEAAGAVPLVHRLRSAGGSVRQRSRAIGQRSAYTQPAISAPSGGSEPAIESSRSVSLRMPSRGMQREQRQRVGMPRALEQLMRRPLLDQPPA
jgi:hypothetical protein